MRYLKKIWEWVSHGDTVWGILNMVFPMLGGTGGGIFAFLSSLPPVVVFFCVLSGIALGLFISNEISARRIKKRLPNQGLISEHGQELTQEHIAECLSFIQQLRVTQDRLVKNVHFNIPESVAHFFTKFCEEPDVRNIVQPDNMATISVRLITERFHDLTFQSLEHQERGKKLTASTITDDNIRYECNKISQAVREYRRMVDEWMKFKEALAVKEVPRFWEKAPWSVNIHEKLADDYDELMALVKNLHNTTPREFQSLLPKDDQLAKFQRYLFGDSQRMVSSL